MTDGFLGPPPPGWQAAADAALAEDLGWGDATAAAVGEAAIAWEVEAQAEGVLCGAGIALYLLGGRLAMADGEALAPGKVVLAGQSEAAWTLARERTALNFLMVLSGTATLASAYVRAVAHTSCQVVDTRKTLPGLRALQKYAVRCGGGRNHRFGLSDGILVKDNHIVAAGSVAEAVRRVRETRLGLKVEVECANLAMVDEAVGHGADVVMLDNMPLDQMAEAVRTHRGKVKFEASGGVRLETVAAVAETGVDFVSVGALTHSAPALPFHLEAR